MKLSVIIPAYNAHNTIKNVLDIVSSWNDTEIIISDDASDEPYDYLRDKYEIKIVRNEVNSGAGVARNLGMQKAIGEWIVFIDADDIPKNTLHESIYSNRITQIINMIVCEVEYLDGDIITNISNDQFFPEYIHGKLYRRSFLVKNHLKFHKELRLFEDTTFQKVVNEVIKKREILMIKSVGYLWKRNRDSTTQKMGEYFDWVFSEKGITENAKASIVALNNLNNFHLNRIDAIKDKKINNDEIQMLSIAYPFNKVISPRKKLSFIIPLYNSHGYIKDTIDDLYKKLDGYEGQFEVICTDDNSDNEDYSYLKNYKDLRIVYNMTRRYMGGNRNRALRIAQGEFVYFLDHDDRIFKEGIDYFMNLDKRDFNAIYLGQKNDTNGNISDCYSASNCAHGKFFRTNYLREENIMFDERIRTSEDDCFVHKVELRLHHQGKDKRIHRNINIPMNLWIYHSDSTLNRKRNNRDYIEEFFIECVRSTIYSTFDKNDKIMKSSKSFLCDRFKELFTWFLNFRDNSKNFKTSNIKVMIAFDCFIHKEFKEDVSIDQNDDIVNFIKSAKFTMTDKQKEKIIHELLVPIKCR